MKILVVGAGAIGGWLAGALAGAGAKVSLLARGPALAAIRRDGLTIIDGLETRIHRIDASDEALELGHPDVIILTVKTYDFDSGVQSVAPHLKPGVGLVTAMNGLPWWFLDGLLADAPRRACDAKLTNVRPIGAVVHGSTRVEAPGVIRIVKLDRFILGEPDGDNSDLTRELARLIASSGISAPLSADIRVDIWSKLWGNLSMNPVSALTGLSAARIIDDAHVGRVKREMMSEFYAVGAALGLKQNGSVDDRIAVARKLGDFRTSMLNDAEAGKRLEIEGLVGVVLNIADKLNVPAPVTRTVHALAHGLDLRNSLRAKS
jgi:2-dehydropantoate 2-reductase